MPSTTSATGSSRPTSAVAVIDLPQPDSPSSARVSPRRAWKLTSLTARTVPVMVRISTVMPSTSSTGWASVWPTVGLWSTAAVMTSSQIRFVVLAKRDRRFCGTVRRHRCPGSVAMRAQAARMVADTVVMTMARPGKNDSHHAVCR